MSKIEHKNLEQSALTRKPRCGNPAWYGKDGKGVSGNPKGRTKGSPNKITRTIREMVLAAVDSYQGGGVALMERYRDSVHKEERIAFITLVGKLVPTEVTGAGGGALVVEVVVEQKPEWISSSSS